MNTKGQAALEYLMTYGWALVIIVIVAGVLFLIALTPSGGVICNSSDPAKFPVSRYNISAGSSPNEIVLQNGTGGNITMTTFGSDGNLNAHVGTATPTGLVLDLNSDVLSNKNVIGGSTVKFTNVCTQANGSLGATCTNGQAYAGSVTVTYTDQFGYSGKTVRITCQGTVR